MIAHTDAPRGTDYVRLSLLLDRLPATSIKLCSTSIANALWGIAVAIFWGQPYPIRGARITEDATTGAAVMLTVEP